LTIKFVSLSEGDRQCCFEAIISIILLLFYYYSDYSSYYTHYSQNKSGIAGEYSLWKSASKLSRGCSNAGDHHFDGNRAQSSSTTTLPCPMDGPVASSPGWAAYVALMYLSQPSCMA
jgi:hypothetical protein